MKFCITGAAGFIGSHLSETLLKKGHDVIGIDNFNDYYDPTLKEQNIATIAQTAAQNNQLFECIRDDICEADALDKIFSEHNFDCVVHLAARAGVRPSISDPLLYERVNGLGTYNILEALKKHNIRHLVFGSSSSVYGLNKKVPFAEEDPVNLTYSPYAQTKRANELACYVYHQLENLNVACLRFFTVYGPRQRPDLAIRKFTQLIYDQQPIPIYGQGDFKRDFTYVDDIIDGVTKAIDWVMTTSEKPRYDIFNLGESATTSVLELIELIEKASGKQAVKDFRPVQPGDVPITYADITKSKKILGYDPKTKIEEGIPKFIKWFETLTVES